MKPIPTNLKSEPLNTKEDLAVVICMGSILLNVVFIVALAIICLSATSCSAHVEDRELDLIETLDQYPITQSIPQIIPQTLEQSESLQGQEETAQMEHCPKIHPCHQYHLDGHRFRPYRPVEVCSTRGHYLILCPGDHLDTGGRDYIWIDTTVHNKYLD